LAIWRVSVGYSARLPQRQIIGPVVVARPALPRRDHVRPVRGSKGKGGEEREHRHAYAEPLAFNNDGAFSNDLALLGLRHPFTRQDVQRAFRAKSLTAHPDHGGDADFFRSLMSARDRALADADGEEPTPGALPS